MHCCAPETSQADQSFAVCPVFLVLALASIINNKTSWMLYVNELQQLGCTAAHHSLII